MTGVIHCNENENLFDIACIINYAHSAERWLIDVENCQKFKQEQLNSLWFGETETAKG